MALPGNLAEISASDAPSGAPEGEKPFAGHGALLSARLHRMASMTRSSFGLIVAVATRPLSNSPPPVHLRFRSHRTNRQSGVVHALPP